MGDLPLISGRNQDRAGTRSPLDEPGDQSLDLADVRSASSGEQDRHAVLDAVAEPGAGAEQEGVRLVRVALAAREVDQRLLGARAAQDLDEVGGQHARTLTQNAGSCRPASQQPRDVTLRRRRGRQLELDAAVLRARGVQRAALEALRVLDRHGVAVALRGQAILGDALLDEVGLHRVGARLRQLLVVLGNLLPACAVSGWSSV